MCPFTLLSRLHMLQVNGLPVFATAAHSHYAQNWCLYCNEANFLQALRGRTAHCSISNGSILLCSRIVCPEACHLNITANFYSWLPYITTARNRRQVKQSVWNNEQENLGTTYICNEIKCFQRKVWWLTFQLLFSLFLWSVATLQPLTEAQCLQTWN